MEPLPCAAAHLPVSSIHPNGPLGLSIEGMEKLSPFAQQLQRWLDPVPLKFMLAPFPSEEVEVTHL